ncbi:MAG: hypothetical protein AAF264_07845, partial [Pseudomonadota bacterium]
VGDAEVTLAPAGARFAERFGIDVEGLRRARPILCRECLDWSARRSHLAGSLGRAFLTRFEEMGWVRRDGATRAVRFTAAGERGFAEMIPAKGEAVRRAKPEREGPRRGSR